MLSHAFRETSLPYIKTVKPLIIPLYWWIHSNRHWLWWLCQKCDWHNNTFGPTGICSRSKQISPYTITNSGVSWGCVKFCYHDSLSDTRVGNKIQNGSVSPNHTYNIPTIREVAQVVGIIAVSFPGIMYGPLHHRLTEGAKIEVLKQKTANFNAHMYLKNLLKASFSGGLTYSTYTDKNWKLRLAQMPQNRAGAAQLTHPPLEDFGPQKTVVIT